MSKTNQFSERHLLMDPDKTAFIRNNRGAVAELARTIDRSPQSVWGWLRGNHGIKESQLADLAAAVGTKPADLLSNASQNYIGILPESDKWAKRKI